MNRVDLFTQLNSLGSSVENFPVNSNVPVTGQTPNLGGSTTKTLVPSTDFVVVRRVAARGVVSAHTV
jgi:hypothetical protein